MQAVSLTPAQQVTSQQVNVSGGQHPTAQPATMMMYPGIYNHPAAPTATLFAVAPDSTSLVGSTFHHQPTESIPVTLTTSSNTMVANSTVVSAAPTVVVVRPSGKEVPKTTTTATINAETARNAATPNKESKDEKPDPIPSQAGEEEKETCCRCQQKAGDEAFLVCQDCGIRGEHFMYETV